MWNLMFVFAAVVLALWMLGNALRRTISGFVDVLLALGGHCGALPPPRRAHKQGGAS